MVRWLPQGYEEKPPARIWAGGVYREVLSRVWQNDLPDLRFVIIAKGRTGSTLLTTSLDSHPDLVCADEILNRPQIDAVRYAARYARRQRSSGFGFHIKPGQVTQVQGFPHLGVFASRMSDAGWKLIHLQRHDVVAQYVSVLRGLQSKEWHRASGSGMAEAPKLIADVPEFVHQIVKRRAGLARERADLAPFAPFYLSYEKDLRQPENRAERLRSLQDWLGIPPETLDSPLRKIVDRDPLDLLENGAEIRAALQQESLLA